MEECDLVAELTREGFSHIFVWEDGPNTDYPEHTHRSETAHIVLSGEMTITTDGQSTTYRAGDRCDVPFGATHSAKMGPEGCRYLVGER
jgi:quercetin dioxygenase-like cupin family protein